MAKKISSLTSKEKVTGLLYVVSLFIIIIGICSYILFVYRSEYHFVDGKNDALEKLERVNSFQNAQSDYYDKITEIDEMVSNINPDVNASYEKRELYYTIGEIKKVTSDNKYDLRYRIFEQVASFYEMKLFDRERLSASQRNIEKFKIELENCRSGIETLKNN